MLDWIGRICGRRGKAWLFAALAILLSVGAPAKQLLAEETAVQETEEQSGVSVHLSAPAAILMEASTGTVIFEQNADVPCSPASITKIMTLLLIFEALEEGDIDLQDEVMTSAYAQSMGGSQVFLEEGEMQTVDTLIKCIAVASGNDAAVAMAEFIAGSEEEFVSRMNEKAQELGMENTHFLDCCGLSDSDDHHTTARDVAVMSRELITQYPEVSIIPRSGWRISPIIRPGEQRLHAVQHQ